MTIHSPPTATRDLERTVLPFPSRPRPRLPGSRTPISPPPKRPGPELTVMPLQHGFVRVSAVIPDAAFDAFMAAWEAGIVPGGAAG